MTDAISLLVAPPTAAGRLCQLLLELGCFIKITETLNTIRDAVHEVSQTLCRWSPLSLSPSLSPSLSLSLSIPPFSHSPPLSIPPSLPPPPSLSLQDSTKRHMLACSVLQSLTAVMRGSPARREVYDSTVSYSKLREMLTALGTTYTQTLSQALNMVGC